MAKTKEEIIQEINNNIPDNTDKKIKPGNVRDAIKATLDMESGSASQDLQETSNKGNFTNKGLVIIDENNPNNIITIKDGKISLQLQSGKEGDPVIIKKIFDITNETIDIKQKYNETSETSTFKIDTDGVTINLSKFDFNDKLILDSLQNDVEIKDADFRKALIDALAISLEEIMVNGSSTKFNLLFKNQARIDLENPMGGNAVSIATNMESSNPYRFGGTVSVGDSNGYFTSLKSNVITYLTPGDSGKLYTYNLPEKNGKIALLSDVDPEVPVISQFSFTKKYYSTFFTHAFTSTSEVCHIKIQDTKPGNVNNLTIKGRIIVFEAYQDFSVMVKLDHQAFGSCWLKTSKSEDLIEELGFFYYDQGQVVFWIRGNTKYSNQHTSIIIDEITAFEPSTDLAWKDEPITEIKNIDENLVNETIAALTIY